MSTQTSDFPDFFRGNQQANVTQFVNEQLVPHTAGVFTYGPFNVTEWDSVVVYALSFDHVLLTLDWYVDAACTIKAGSQSFTTGRTQYVHDQVPALGGWLIVTADWHTGVGTVSTSLTLTARRGSRVWPGMLQDLVLWGITGFSVAAGATATVHASALTTGRAALSVNSSATVWQATVFAYDQAGTKVAQLARLENTTTLADNDRTLILPPYDVGMELHNGDASARTFDYGLVASPVP